MRGVSLAAHHWTAAKKFPPCAFPRSGRSLSPDCCYVERLYLPGGRTKSSYGPGERISPLRPIFPCRFNSASHFRVFSTAALSQADSFLQIAELIGLPEVANGSNFVFSPLSLRAALSLTAVAARGETLQHLLTFLASPTSDHLHSASARLVEAIRGDEKLNLSIVNGAWLDRSIVPNPLFVEVASTIYGAVAETVDFINEAPIAEKKINDWVEEKTNEIIKNLIPAGTLNSSTRLVLANALYFKGKWEEPFDRSMTKADTFYLLDGSTVQAPFMSSKKEQIISSFDSFSVLKLPYEEQEGRRLNSSRFSLLLFLPNEKNGIHGLTKRVVSEPNFIKEHVPYQHVKVSKFMVPRFKISFDFEANGALKYLGLRNIFEPDVADLSGLCLEPSEGHDLFVSNVIQKAKIEVDEEGRYDFGSMFFIHGLHSSAGELCG